MSRATRENGVVPTPTAPPTPAGRRPPRGSTRSGLPGAIVAVVLVVVGSIVALGVADITPSSALPSAIAVGRVPSQTTPTTPPTAPLTTVRTVPPATIPPPVTSDTTTRVAVEPKVSIQDDKGDTITSNADDRVGTDGSTSTHPPRHPRDN